MRARDCTGDDTHSGLSCSECPSRVSNGRTLRLEIGEGEGSTTLRLLGFLTLAAVHSRSQARGLQSHVRTDPVADRANNWESHDSAIFIKLLPVTTLHRCPT
jgi:hypothetical protein